MTKRRHTHWFVMVPGNVYANDFWLNTPGTSADARAWVREWLKVSRLPNDTCVWPA